jgi:DNA helicase-2/ATP-dependent DNA helicase PcrA
LIDRLTAPGRPLKAPADADEQRRSLERLRQLAGELARAESGTPGQPGCGTRELIRRLAATLPGARKPRVRERSAAPVEHASGPPVDRDDDAQRAAAALPAAELALSGTPDARLQAALALMREEVLEGVMRIGGRLGELRLDTELDVAHGVARYLELLKLAALLQRPAGQSLEDALADINARLLAATTPVEREILQSSPLDDALLADERGEALGPRGAPTPAIAPREESSLGPFLPRKGFGLALSASDIANYLSCPLRYKYTRVLRIPTEQTLSQRFGIAVHQVLERFHSGEEDSLGRMLELFEVAWSRGGFSDGEQERELHRKARAALTRYHARLHDHESEPVWFERSFSFRLGPHHLRGRVDRVDRLERCEHAYELIDYKTSRPRTPEQLKDDIQLSLYALAAREDWRLESSRQAYYYVLDDQKVPAGGGHADARALEDTVLEVGEGILAQRFEPTPSPAVCTMCEYRIACPVAELA